MAEQDKKKEVFISYCTANSELAQYFCSLLEGSGIACWIAPRDIPSGGDWAANIVKGLEECRVVVFMVSKASVNSKEVAKEIGLANSFKNIEEILQVRLEDAPLTPAILYHLSNKQWVDALEGEKNVRFEGALKAIRKVLNKEEQAVVAVDSNSLQGQARRLLESLRNTHGTALDVLNTPISLEEFDTESVRFSLPLRFGAFGLDLIFEFKTENGICNIEFYANAASSGDSLQYIFWNHFLAKTGSEIDRLFPKKAMNRANRWRCLHLIPETCVSTSLISAAEAFCLFNAHVLALSARFIPPLLSWAWYVKEAVDAVARIQEGLAQHFPESDGWQIGAPEGERLGSLRQHGKLCVYRKAWEPQATNYRGRGLLSFVLESGDNFLKDLYIGVLKYEEWHDLGDWEELLQVKAVALAGQSEKSESWWPWWQWLDSPWQDSGISTATNNWDGRLDEFVEYCINKFKALKPLAEDIDAACQVIPGLQDKEPDTLPQRDWRQDKLYIRNRLRLIAEDLKLRLSSDPIGVEYRFEDAGDRWLGKLLLIIAVAQPAEVVDEQFEVAVVFQFNHREMNTTITNLSPPDIETEVTRRFIKQYFSETLQLLDKSLKSDADCGGKSLSAWLDDAQKYVDEQVDGLVNVLRGLRNHLDTLVALTESVAFALAEKLPTEDAWTVDNKARALLPENAVNIYRESWRLQYSDLPDVMVQISPDAACFDHLSLTLKLLGHSRPETDRLLGGIIGGCNVAYGYGKADADSLWMKKFDHPHLATGGSDFEKPLINGADRDAFLEYVSQIAAKLILVAPLIDSLCEKLNELKAKELIEVFWNRLHQGIKEQYQADKWIITFDTNEQGMLLITKPEWKSLFKIGFGRFAANTWLGVWCDCNENSITSTYQGIVANLKATDKNMSKDTQWWPGWLYTGRDFRKAEDIALLAAGKQHEIIGDYIAKLDHVVRCSVPVIEMHLGITKTMATSEDHDKEPER